LEGLQLIRTVRPDYIILDIILPKIDGGRVCWLLRQDAQLRNTPIIAFSGLGPQDFRRFPELSADAYVAKGPLSLVTNNILLAIKYVEERGRGDIQGGIFGYEGFHPRQLISEMVYLKRRYESLVRTFGSGVLELDTEGQILMANAAAASLLGKREARLISQSFPALFPARERRVIQEVLEELQRSQTGETVRITASLGATQLSLGFSCAAEEGELTGILVTMEPTHPGRHSETAPAE
jgi:CheY-like chemotaxis protein